MCAWFYESYVKPKAWSVLCFWLSKATSWIFLSCSFWKLKPIIPLWVMYHEHFVINSKRLSPSHRNGYSLIPLRAKQPVGTIWWAFCESHFHLNESNMTCWTIMTWWISVKISHVLYFFFALCTDILWVELTMSTFRDHWEWLRITCIYNKIQLCLKGIKSAVIYLR